MRSAEVEAETQRDCFPQNSAKVKQVCRLSALQLQRIVSIGKLLKQKTKNRPTESKELICQTYLCSECLIQETARINKRDCASRNNSPRILSMYAPRISQDFRLVNICMPLGLALGCELQPGNKKGNRLTSSALEAQPSSPASTHRNLDRQSG